MLVNTMVGHIGLHQVRSNRMPVMDGRDQPEQQHRDHAEPRGDHPDWTLAHGIHAPIPMRSLARRQLAIKYEVCGGDHVVTKGKLQRAAPVGAALSL
jgi:hypothetical protein